LPCSWRACSESFPSFFSFPCRAQSSLAILPLFRVSPFPRFAPTLFRAFPGFLCSSQRLLPLPFPPWIGLKPFGFSLFPSGCVEDDFFFHLPCSSPEVTYKFLRPPPLVKRAPAVFSTPPLASWLKILRRPATLSLIPPFF